MKLMCFNCSQGEYQSKIEDYSSILPNGQNLVVKDIQILHCPQCGDECIPPESSRAIDRARFGAKGEYFGELCCGPFEIKILRRNV